MADLVIYIPNHGYATASNTYVYVSWLDAFYYTADEDTDSFKLAIESAGSDYVQFTETVSEGYVVQSVVAGSATITGLEHLEGKSVSVMQQGIVISTEIVSNGSITAPVTSLTNPMVGMTYTSIVKPMKLDLQGMGLTVTKKINRGVFNVFETIGGEVGGSTSTMQDIPTGTAALFTGYKEIPLKDGYSRSGDILAQQTQPLPMTILSFNLDVNANAD